MGFMCFWGTSEDYGSEGSYLNILHAYDMYIPETASVWKSHKRQGPGSLHSRNRTKTIAVKNLSLLFIALPKPVA